MTASADSLEERVAILEKELGERDESVTFLATVITGFAEARLLGSSLDEFFAHPEDWEIVIPVDPKGQCRKECGAEFRAEAQGRCQTLPLNERKVCVDAAYALMRRCTHTCWEQNQ